MPARRTFIICACVILSSCGTSALLSEPKYGESRSASEATSPVRVPSPAPAPIPAPDYGVPAYGDPAVEATVPPTTATPECLNGSQESRNVTSDSYDLYRCVKGEWAFQEQRSVPTTTAASASGTRDNPFSPIALTYGDWSTLSILPIEVVDPALIHSANQFNDEAAPGQTYARIFVSAIYAGAEKGGSYEFRYGFGLAGDKGKIYDAASVSDTRNVLSDISDSPDVLAGGELSGFIYYLVDADDTNFLVVATGPDGLQFIDVSP